MFELQHKRRSFLLGLAGLGIRQTLLQGQTAAQAATSQGYVFGPDGGDHLVHYRNPGKIFIKVDPTKGSPISLWAPLSRACGRVGSGREDVDGREDGPAASRGGMSLRWHDTRRG